MNENELLKKEAEAFDNQVDERIKNGFIPDLRKLKNVEWFYNNMWRDPEFVKIHLMSRINFVIDIAKKKGGKVLEVGCGHGYLSLELARNGLDVLGIDLSQKSIEIANKFSKLNEFKENFGSLNYISGDIYSMDLKENEFDTIIFFGTFHHMPDMGKIMEIINKITKNEGHLIICEPIRDSFSKKSAEFAAIFRAISPTWIPYKEKLKNLDNKKSWEKYVDKIYNEYTYKDEHEQSPFDNVTSSKEHMIQAVEKYFKINTIKYSNSFVDKLIGGIRGENKYEIAKFLKFLDQYFVDNNILPPTSMDLHATIIKN